jgi:hypothetical protein
MKHHLGALTIAAFMLSSEICLAVPHAFVQLKVYPATHVTLRSQTDLNGLPSNYAIYTCVFDVPSLSMGGNPFTVGWYRMKDFAFSANGASGPINLRVYFGRGRNLEEIYKSKYLLCSTTQSVTPAFLQQYHDFNTNYNPDLLTYDTDGLTTLLQLINNPPAQQSQAPKDRNMLIFECAISSLPATSTLVANFDFEIYFTQMYEQPVY